MDWFLYDIGLRHEELSQLLFNFIPPENPEIISDPRFCDDFKGNRR